jgi:DNA polymerase family B, exonuclease domain
LDRLQGLVCRPFPFVLTKKGVKDYHSSSSGKLTRESAGRDSWHAIAYNFLWVIAAILEQGIPIDSLGITRGFATYESNVLFVLRFMVDCSILGGNWVEMPAGTYSSALLDSPTRLTHCQIEVHCHFSTIISHPPEGGLS